MLSKKRRKKSIKNNKSSICSTIAEELEEKGIVIKGGQNDLDNEEIKRGEKLKRRLGGSRQDTCTDLQQILLSKKDQYSITAIDNRSDTRENRRDAFLKKDAT